MKILNQLRFGFVLCSWMLIAAATQAQTYNLHTLEPASIPAGATLEWHNAIPVSAANLLSNIAAGMVGSGTYYQVYNMGSCYSTASPVRIAMTNCANSTVDLYTLVDSTIKPAGMVVTFHTASPATVANTYSGNVHTAPAGKYYTAYYDAVQGCYTYETAIKIMPNLVCGTNPDFNVTHLNVLVNGNVNTNDNVPAGSTCGTPVAQAGNPSASLPVMNANGTYTFTPSNTGVYVFNVPVCSPDTAIACVTETLTITVTNPYINNNPPIVNPDVTSVDSGSTVNIPVKNNDQPGNPGGSLGTPTIVSQPPHGTVTVNPDGTVHYVPTPGFTGVDTFVYNVCDTSLTPNLCHSATVTINVNPNPATTNTILANDDFNHILMNTSASGNVRANDIDPDGDPMKVTAQTNVTIAGAGTFSVDTLGNYTFTPNHDFFGPVQIPYTVCDNQGHCATATLHVLVDPVNTLNPDFNVTYINVSVAGNMATNDHLIPGSSFSNTAIAQAGNPNTVLPTINPDGTYTFTPTEPGVYVFNVPVCPPGITVNCPLEMLTITALNPAINSNAPVANPDMSSVDSGHSVAIPVRANDYPGNTGGSLGLPTPTIPAHGTATTNPNGTIQYTPNPGFVGTDTFTYTVCDTSLNPDKCATTTVTVNVLPTNSPNSTLGVDDYTTTITTTPVLGNVLMNDIDPEDNTQSVTPQTITLSSGTLQLTAEGNYTFTAAAGFTGPVNFTYTVCDAVSPTSACSQATLYILIRPEDMILGLSIVDFRGKALYNTNQLTWKVSDAENVSAYEIMQSADLQKWTSLGQVRDNSLRGNQTFNMIDNMPQIENYYKLIYTDNAGKKVTYPKMVYLRGYASDLVAIYPNPAQTKINFEYNSNQSDMDVEITVMDVMGRKRKTVHVNIEKGKNVFPILINDLVDGTYLIRYYNHLNGNNGSFKFVKEAK